MIAPKTRSAARDYPSQKKQRDPISAVSLGDLSARDFAARRDRRVREVTPGTVIRDMILLSAILTVAKMERGLFY